jgi:glycosyltransferase involved in cell wall biosynthesis
VDVSGVLFAGLAFGKAMVLSDVGGFSEMVEDHGAGRLVPPGHSTALATAIDDLLAKPQERARLERLAAEAAAGPYSWDRVAERTLGVYEEVLA